MIIGQVISFLIFSNEVGSGFCWFSGRSERPSSCTTTWCRLAPTGTFGSNKTSARCLCCKNSSDRRSDQKIQWQRNSRRREVEVLHELRLPRNKSCKLKVFQLLQWLIARMTGHRWRPRSLGKTTRLSPWFDAWHCAQHGQEMFVPERRQLVRESLLVAFLLEECRPQALLLAVKLDDRQPDNLLDNGHA